MVGAPHQKGFSLVELLLAVALFGLVVVSFMGAFAVAKESVFQAGNHTKAVFIAEEGLEAVRSIRDDDFSSLTPGTYGIATSSGSWEFSGSSDAVDIFTRQIDIGSIDGNHRYATSTVSWTGLRGTQNSVVVATLFSNWQSLAGVASDNLQVGTTSAAVNGSDTGLVEGITLQNTSDTTNITLDQMIVSWSGAPGGTKLQEISINSVSVWTGNANSGVTADIVDVTLLQGAPATPIDSLDFSKDMTGTTVTITFVMSDASTKTEIITLSGGGGGDTTAPDAVSDLALSNETTTTLDLSWTAPGDDGATGTATSYDVRYSTALITEANWGSATQATGEPTPSAAGASESMTLTGLSSNTTYYVAIKTSDEVPNISAISNVPNATTLVSAEADDLNVDISGVGLDGGDTSRAVGITLENTGLSTITIDQITVSWTGAPGGTKLKEISIDASSVWTGNGNTGVTANITDVAITSSTTIPLTFIDWSKSMSGTTFSLTFIMSDATTQTVNNITP